MTKTEYLLQLDKHLRKLPKADYEEAMAYFTEYFEEAGEGNEAQVMADLGTPKEVANDIIHSILTRSETVTSHKERKKSQMVWLVILGVLSAPVALPIAFSLLVIILSLFLTVVCLLFSGFLLSFAGFLVGIVTVVDAFRLLGHGSAFVLGLGGGLAALGAALLLAVVSAYLSKIFTQGLVNLVKMILRKIRKEQKNGN